MNAPATLPAPGTYWASVRAGAFPQCHGFYPSRNAATRPHGSGCTVLPVRVTAAGTVEVRADLLGAIDLLPTFPTF